MDSQGKFAYVQTWTAIIIIKWTDVDRAVVQKPEKMQKIPKVILFYQIQNVPE